LLLRAARDFEGGGGKRPEARCAVFVGGMEGIRTEYRKFRGQFGERPVYAFGVPGGEARELR
jgi:hypothetical protein